MRTTNQPSLMPTRKLLTALLGSIVGTLVYSFLVAYMPALSGVMVEGVGGLELSLQLIFQTVFAAIPAYYVRDKPNVGNAE